MAGRDRTVVLMVSWGVPRSSQTEVQKEERAAQASEDPEYRYATGPGVTRSAMAGAHWEGDRGREKRKIGEGRNGRTRHWE